VRRLVIFLMGTPGTPRLFVRRSAAILMLAALTGTTILALSTVHHVYFDRRDLPDLGPLMRFELPTIGHVYDTNGQPLIELASEYRQITPYEDIPPIVRDAILAAEDKRFFSHNGVDYLSIPRVLSKITPGGRTMFPQGGSTITQQLVRGLFLEHLTSLAHTNVNMLRRKREEIRLSLWLEERMRQQFGSKRRAKEEIFARYASFVYLGRGQYGFARAAEYYFGRPLSSFTADDADSAALLAGIMKSPRDYSPAAKDTGPVLRRRNQILALMKAQGFISRERMTLATARPFPVIVPHPSQPFRSSAVVEHVLAELTAADAALDLDDLLQGRIQVHSTVDARVQRIASDALEHGLAAYEQRHPNTRGIVQGSIVVLRNRDGSILAETGGRQVYRGRATSFSDFNRVRQSLRQPGSAMKPMVYLAAFQSGEFTLDTLVPDEPISVPTGRTSAPKWISNYDGEFKGLIPIRQALAESRNAVAIWLTEQIGIDAVLRASRTVGVQTPLHRYATTALGASEVNLLELATAYRTIASGILAQPYVIRRVVSDTGDIVGSEKPLRPPVALDAVALALIQEGLRGVVRIPTGTAHALDSRGFPIAVMGKTGTTSDFRDALFVGSTYGPDGITVAVRVGFDNGRSLGPNETGGRVAMPVFEELMLKVYRDKLVGPAPAFPGQMEENITRYLEGDAVLIDAARRADLSGPPRAGPERPGLRTSRRPF
jgi:penicillin-binding protein 1A